MCKIQAYNAAELKVVVDFNQLVESVLVQDDELFKRWAHFPGTVQTVYDVLLVLLEHKQNVEHLRLTSRHRQCEN